MRHSLDVVVALVAALTAACGARSELGDPPPTGRNLPAVKPPGAARPGARGDDAGTAAHDAGRADTGSAGSANPVEIAVGNAFTCARSGLGTVRCWGWNLDGELGDGTTEERRTPVAVRGLANVTQVAAGGGNHACALIADGTVRCWGWNDAGQLGFDGDERCGDDLPRPCSRTPKPVEGLKGVARLAVGAWHSCAILRDGSVQCWGRNDYAQLGDRPLERRVPRAAPVPGLAKVRQLALGWEHSCALLEDGTVQCWGGNGRRVLGYSPDETCIMFGSFTQPCSRTPRKVLENAAEITSSYRGTCARLETGGITCWGWFPHDGWGDSGPLASFSRDVGAISMGGNIWVKLCALRTGGAVECRGTGYLGDGRKSRAPAEVVSLDLGKIATLATGEHSCALDASGAVWCWGWNDHGQVGDGSTAREVASPVRVRW